MIALLGDIHGNSHVLEYATRMARKNGASALVQLGDLGFFPSTLKQFQLLRPELPVCFINGNHENFDLLYNTQWPLAGGLTYLWRSGVFTLDDRTIGYLGGGDSIDKDIRLAKGMPWDERERTTADDVALLLHAAELKGGVDVLLTHCPPQDFIQKHFEKDPDRKTRLFGVPRDWRDESADRVQEAWEALGKPHLYCAHMHESIKDTDCSGGFVRCLNESEMALI